MCVGFAQLRLFVDPNRPQIKKYNREIRVPAEPDNSENIVESVLDFGDRFLRDEVPD